MHMSKAAKTPRKAPAIPPRGKSTPVTPRKAPAGKSAAVTPHGMETRVAVLETQADNLREVVATKEDLANLGKKIALKVANSKNKVARLLAK
ncbi:MAG: hypothetical protein OD918_03730, partial [Gammaproteobacteria bacterium]